MKHKEPINPNYSALITTISSITPIEGCDNIVSATASGYHIVVSKDTKKGDVGIYFPVGTQLSENFLSNNNLYRKAEKNKDDKKGFFENTGRLKAIRLRGVQSNGLFVPLDSLSYLLSQDEIGDLNVGDTFDHIKNEMICQKYIIKKPCIQGKGNKNKIKARYSKLVDNQFRFHYKTTHLQHNMESLQSDSRITITKKLHGTSAVFSKVLIKKKLSFISKLLKKFGLPIKSEENGFLYSSRQVIKNEFYSKNLGFYKENIWNTWANKIEDSIPSGFTIYGEIVGYLGNGGFIQKDFDYGCLHGESQFYVYRVTFTNNDGKVFELSWNDLKDFCKAYGFEHVQEFYQGKVEELFPDIDYKEDWRTVWLKELENCEEFEMNDADCSWHKHHSVPSEGIVVRKEDMMNPQAFKLKNYRFLEKESRLMDKGEVDIEEEN